MKMASAVKNSRRIDTGSCSVKGHTYCPKIESTLQRSGYANAHQKQKVSALAKQIAQFNNSLTKQRVGKHNNQAVTNFANVEIPIAILIVCQNVVARAVLRSGHNRGNTTIQNSDSHQLDE